MQKTTFTICMLLTIFTACSDITDNDKLNSNTIQCSVSVETELAPELTKGTPINSATDPGFKYIGVLGYHTSGSFTSATTASSSFLPNSMVTKNTNNKWDFEKTYLWPQTGKVSFFAYAPYASATNGIVIDALQGSSPSLTYTVPTSVADQPDLMVATPQMDLFKTTVPLQFSHALACIGFDVSGENVPIEYIAVKSVYTSGKLMLNMANKTPQWLDLSGMSTDLYKIGLIPNAEATNPTTPVMATNGYLMMIPQILGNDAAIVVKFQGMDAKEIPLKVAGTSTWLAGNKYIYSLKEGTYTLNVDVTGNNCVYTGGDVTLNIKSIYTSQAGLTQNLDWKAEIIPPSTSDTEWTRLFSLELLNDPTTTKTFNLDIAPYTTTSVIDNALKNADPIQAANIKDLSFVNGTYTTANCYVVNAPGWYKFPCGVMGNAISKGANSETINNPDCFIKTTPSFLNYAGTSITSIDQLAIDTQGADAHLIWSDAPDLVTNIGISDKGKYIEFYVSPATIRQGNAIVAIRKNGQVMWSWHIWVTDWVPNTKNQSLGSGNQSIMPFGIGRCSAASYNYAQRSITIRFTQNTSNITKDVTIIQQANTSTYGENVCYYQWGRKDPMLASNGLDATSKSCFGPSQFAISTTTAPVNLNYGILNPQTFYASPVFPSNWETPISFMLWGANIITNGNVKTIYDPSPAGYMVPSQNTIYAIVGMQSMHVATPVNGFQFSPNSNGDYSVFLAITGGRGPNDGTIMNVQSNDQSGYYWSNSNYMISPTPENKNTYLNLLLSVFGTPQVDTQVNPSASAIPVCAAVE